MRKPGGIVALIVAGLMVGYKYLITLLAALGYIDFIVNQHGRIPSIWKFYFTSIGMTVLQLVGVCTFVATVITLISYQRRMGAEARVSVEGKKPKPGFVLMSPEWMFVRFLGPKGMQAIVLPICNDTQAHAEYVKARMVLRHRGPEHFAEVHVKAAIWADSRYGESPTCLAVPRVETRHLILVGKDDKGFWALNQTVQGASTFMNFLPVGYGPWQILIVVSAVEHTQEFNLLLQLSAEGFQFSLRVPKPSWLSRLRMSKHNK